QFPDGTAAEPYRRASLAPTIPWFDHHLMKMPLEEALRAPVRLYIMGENVWRDEREWPLARTEYTPFYLRSAGQANSASGDGRVVRGRPGAPEPADTYVYDPRDPVPSRGGAMLGNRAGIALQDDVERRSDVLVYTSEPLDKDLEITGPISAVLHVGT